MTGLKLLADGSVFCSFDLVWDNESFFPAPRAQSDNNTLSLLGESIVSRFIVRKTQ